MAPGTKIVEITRRKPQLDLLYTVSEKNGEPLSLEVPEFEHSDLGSSILYHRAFGAPSRTLIGIGGEFFNFPIRHSIGMQRPKNWHPLYVIDEQTPDQLYSFIDGIAAIVIDQAKRHYLCQTNVAVVDNFSHSILDHLAASYRPLPILFTQVTIPSSDILDLGFSHQIGSRMAFQNLARFFEQLGTYKPTGPDFNYTHLRQAGWPCDKRNL